MPLLDLEQNENNMTIKDRHKAVMSREVLDYLELQEGDCVVDATVGLGGHAQLLSQVIGSPGYVIAIDRDKQSLSMAQENLKGSLSQIRFIHDDFRNMDHILQDLGVEKVDGILFDLGISSFQLEDSTRGFSFKADGPLDMRINQESFLSAYDLINSLSEREIALILKNYGEERWHNRIAHHLVRQRSKNPIQTTQELRQLVIKAMPHARTREKIDPATRTFQAFRIAVNRELESLEIALKKVLPYLKNTSRICVISFHSLEDRIVKQQFRSWHQERIAKLITKKPLRPTRDEVRDNPRSRSARLRVAEKV